MKKDLLLTPLHYYAIKFADQAQEPQELRKNDFTNLLWKEFQQRIKKGKPINVQIRGEQASGKSLLGFVFMLKINRWRGVETQVWNICPDQFDFLDRVKNMDISHTCMQIDEWNEMSTTGYNATTNMALLTNFNEVQAQRHIDKIACSPQKVLDQTASIRIDVIDRDKESKTTTAYISYVISRESIVYEQLLGHIIVDVSEGIENPLWEAYLKRKFMRMNMLMEKGILDTRKGDDSQIILKVVEELREMAIEQGFVQRDLVRSFIEYVQEKYTAISIYGEDKLTGTIYGALTLLKSIYNINIKIDKLQKVIGKLEPTMIREKLHFQNQLDMWKRNKAKVAKAFEKSMNHHEDIVDTLKEFAEVGT